MNHNPKENDRCKSFVRQVKQLDCFRMFPNDFELVHNCNESPQAWGMNPYQAKNWNISQLQMGKLAGLADYTVYYNRGGEDFARVACIEFKRSETEIKQFEKGKFPNQLAFREKCLKLKIPYLLTCSEEEAVEFMKDLLE